MCDLKYPPFSVNPAIGQITWKHTKQSPYRALQLQHRIHVHVSVSDVCIPLVTEVKSSLELNKLWHTTMEQRSCASKRSNKKSKFSRKILFMRCPNRKAKSIVRPKSCHHSIKPLFTASEKMTSIHYTCWTRMSRSSSRHSRNLGGGTCLIFFDGRQCADLIKKSSTRIEHATCGRQKKNITNPP